MSKSDLERAALICISVAEASDHPERKLGAFACAGKIREAAEAEGDPADELTEEAERLGVYRGLPFEPKDAIVTPLDLKVVVLGAPPVREPEDIFDVMGDVFEQHPPGLGSGEKPKRGHNWKAAAKYYRKWVGSLRALHNFTPGPATANTCPCGNGDVGTFHSCGMGAHCKWHQRGYEAGQLALTSSAMNCGECGMPTEHMLTLRSRIKELEGALLAMTEARDGFMATARGLEDIIHSQPTWQDYEIDTDDVCTLEGFDGVCLMTGEVSASTGLRMTRATARTLADRLNALLHRTEPGFSQYDDDQAWKDAGCPAVWPEQTAEVLPGSLEWANQVARSDGWSAGYVAATEAMAKTVATKTDAQLDADIAKLEQNPRVQQRLRAGLAYEAHASLSDWVCQRCNLAYDMVEEKLWCEGATPHQYRLRGRGGNSEIGGPGWKKLSEVTEALRVALGEEPGVDMDPTLAVARLAARGTQPDEPTFAERMAVFGHEVGNDERCIKCGHNWRNMPYTQCEDRRI